MKKRWVKEKQRSELREMKRGEVEKKKKVE